MTERPDSEERSSPAPEEELLQWEVPEVEGVEVYVVRLEDGRVVARTAEELEEEGIEGRR